MQPAHGQVEAVPAEDRHFEEAGLARKLASCIYSTDSGDNTSQVPAERPLAKRFSCPFWSFFEFLY